MPAGNTYVAIAEQTLGSAAASVTFSSIPGTYTDLILVCSLGASNAAQDFKIQFNGDTATNYSVTLMRGTGASAISNRESNIAYIYLDYTGVTQNVVQSQYNVNIMNYANTTTYKTILSRRSDVGYSTEAGVGLWRNTAAITSIVVGMTAGNLITGSTFSLYGIASA
jgi:hypothetical protein